MRLEIPIADAPSAVTVDPSRRTMVMLRESLAKVGKGREFLQATKIDYGGRGQAAAILIDLVSVYPGKPLLRVTGAPAGTWAEAVESAALAAVAKLGVVLADWGLPSPKCARCKRVLFRAESCLAGLGGSIVVRRDTASMSCKFQVSLLPVQIYAPHGNEVCEGVFTCDKCGGVVGNAIRPTKGRDEGYVVLANKTGVHDKPRPEGLEAYDYEWYAQEDDGAEESDQDYGYGTWDSEDGKEASGSSDEWRVLGDCTGTDNCARCAEATAAHPALAEQLAAIRDNRDSAAATDRTGPDDPTFDLETAIYEEEEARKQAARAEYECDGCPDCFGFPDYHVVEEAMEADHRVVEAAAVAERARAARKSERTTAANTLVRWRKRRLEVFDEQDRQIDRDILEDWKNAS
jgi:hypothetical protein